MEETRIGLAELNSISTLNRKRKLQTGLLEMPLPKHVCWSKKLELEFSSDSTLDPKNMRSSIFALGDEPEPDQVSASISYSCPSFMSSHDDAKTYLSSPYTHACIEPSTSSTCLNSGTFSQLGLNSSESKLLTKASSSKPDSSPICELDHEYELHTSDDYNDQLLEFEHCTDKDLDDLLYSNGGANVDYVLSSGRWSVNQDSQEGTKKLTIDKEFEQYFSMLMM